MTQSNKAIFEFDQQTSAFPQQANAGSLLLPDRSTRVIRFYTSDNVTLAGTCVTIDQGTFGGEPAQFNVRTVFNNLELRTGWNTLTYVVQLREISTTPLVFEDTFSYSMGIAPDATDLLVFPAAR